MGICLPCLSGSVEDDQPSPVSLSLKIEKHGVKSKIYKIQLSSEPNAVCLRRE